MSRTFRTSRPIPADLGLSQERPVKESTLKRFAKAFKKITHHRERRAVSREIAGQMEEAL